jgi:transcriptional regulator with XRE-family HTH domain
MDSKKRLGQIIRELRKAKGYSQEAFAAKCKIHRTHMGLIENGKTNITLENIEKIAEQLDVSMAELFKKFK